MQRDLIGTRRVVVDGSGNEYKETGKKEGESGRLLVNR